MTLGKVYLLDDDEDMLSLIQEMIESVDLVCNSFSQGKVFFEQVTHFEKHSLMVLDLHMPEMDGIEVMRRLATMENPPALILISGHDISVLHSAQKLGYEHKLNIFRTITKPIHLKDFQQILLKYYSRLILNKSKESKRSLSSNGEEISPKELLEAIQKRQLVLFYQPQIDISSGDCYACEALVRWKHPKKGLIFPDQFIGIAEANGWMGILTNEVLKQAVEQEFIWSQKGYKINISVNVSADNITSLSLPEQISALLIANKITPTMLTLEVTESALMGELVTSLDILTRLRLKGLGLSIDDFGTGYSSLSQLHKIPFSELKVDQSFVLSMLYDDEARAIVKTCIVLGHELNMEVVAEGVETKAHFELLKSMGCDIAQGYYFSKAVPPLEMEEFYQKQNNLVIQLIEYN